MNKPVAPQWLAGDDPSGAHERWQAEYRETIGQDRAVENVSGIQIQPLYTPKDWTAYGRDNPLG